jgi:hypothetical protein
MSKKKPWQTVLKYYGKNSRMPSRSTIRRCYSDWRQDNGLFRRCDNPECVFHTEPLEWNGEDLPVILDHVNGNSRDNSRLNLRYLCPNCDSQLLTRAGKNKGRIVDETEGGYATLEKDGRRSCWVFLRPKTMLIFGVPISLQVNDSCSVEKQ